MRIILAAGVMAVALTCPGDPSEQGNLIFCEEFADLAAWREWTFDTIEKESAYAIEQVAGTDVLSAKAKESASGLILDRTFTMKPGLAIRWRWRVLQAPDGESPLQRDGDDCALRVYVIFEQDASDVGWFKRLFLKNTQFQNKGKFPERSIAYAWSLRPDLPDHFPNPFTDKVWVFPLSHDPQELGEWTTEHACPIQDYKKAFGKDPPDSFRLAIMCDADNTKSRAEGQLDFIEIRQKSQNCEE